jgi:hypothetical protein
MVAEMSSPPRHIRKLAWESELPDKPTPGRQGCLPHNFRRPSAFLHGAAILDIHSFYGTEKSLFGPVSTNIVLCFPECLGVVQDRERVG